MQGIPKGRAYGGLHTGEIAPHLDPSRQGEVVSMQRFHGRDPRPRFYQKDFPDTSRLVHTEVVEKRRDAAAH